MKWVRDAENSEPTMNGNLGFYVEIMMGDEKGLDAGMNRDG